MPDELEVNPLLGILVADKGRPLISFAAVPSILRNPDGKQMVGVSLCGIDEQGGLTQFLAMPGYSAEALAVDLLRMLALARDQLEPPMPDPGANPPALDLSAFPVPPPSGTP